MATYRAVDSGARLGLLEGIGAVPLVRVMRGSILSRSRKRLNDAWLGLLVSVPHEGGKCRGRERGREKS